MGSARLLILDCLKGFLHTLNDQNDSTWKRTQYNKFKMKDNSFAAFLTYNV